MGKSGKAKAKSASKKAPGRASAAAGKARASQQARSLVALYGLEAECERGRTVRAVMDELGIAVRTIAPANLNDPVGAVAGMMGMRPSRVPWAGEAPEGEFMLVCNCSSSQLDKLLAAMREADVSIAHKAQVTQYNRLWPLRKLMQEVAQEHAVMNAQGKE